MTVLPGMLKALRAVVAAVVDGDGGLVEANEGFLRLLPETAGNATRRRVGRFFIQPTFDALLQASSARDASGYAGLLTLGDTTVKTRTLRGQVTPCSGGLLLLAEYDIDELEMLNEEMLTLQRSAALGQRQLVGANANLRENEGRIIEASLIDPLTGIGNRRKMDQALALEIARARRTGAPLSMLMADVDHFKRVNDVYGHPAGDQVLAWLGKLFRTQTRITDTAARFGGEEFVLLLVGADLALAVGKAEQLRASVEQQVIPPLRSPVTASFGVAQLGPDEDAAGLLARVDAALYQAKQGGRNRVVSAGRAAGRP
jgi:two-component system cell cycle response regulator